MTSRRSADPPVRAPIEPPVLHELEAEVMDEVWRQETATVRSVMEALNRKADLLAIASP